MPKTHPDYKAEYKTLKLSHVPKKDPDDEIVEMIVAIKIEILLPYKGEKIQICKNILSKKKIDLLIKNKIFY